MSISRIAPAFLRFACLAPPFIERDYPSKVADWLLPLLVFLSESAVEQAKDEAISDGIRGYYKVR